MGKWQSESYQEYRKRAMDPISKAWCSAKAYNSTIWLNSGVTTSCHHPPGHKINIDEIAVNPKAIHNTEQKKEDRREMLQGRLPDGCEYCIKMEAIGDHIVSDRVFKTVIYSDEENNEVLELGPDYDYNLKTLEIAFDSTCNFACSYCNPSFSTTWGKDIKKNGAYQNLVSDGAGAFQQDGKWTQLFREEDNPYIQAFWKWWYSDLKDSLQELRITGGEALMSDSVWKLFDFFEANVQNDMLFSINTNLGAKQSLIQRLIDKSHHVKNLDIYTSCEATGSQAEYIRDGLDYNQWKENMERTITDGNIRAFHVMMTINSLCLYTITDFMDEMLEMKMKHGKHFPTWSVNVLRFPSFMSPLALPEHLKTERHDHLKSWLDSVRDHPMIHEMEIDGVSRLIDYLDVVKTPHRRTSSLDSQHSDFKSFYEQYDKRRGLDFRATFPKILVDWYDTLEPEIKHVGNLAHGDSTKGFHDENPGQNENGDET